MNNKMLTLSEAAEYLGLHPKTLQRLDRKGELTAARTFTYRRVYSKASLDDYKRRKMRKVAKSLGIKIAAMIERCYARMEP